MKKTKGRGWIFFAALLFVFIMNGKRGFCSEEDIGQNEEKLEQQETSIVYDYDMQPAFELGISTISYPNAYNAYSDLKTATSIVRQGDYFFITDTYHNQVLYSRSLDEPVTRWKVMTQDVELPHGIASDGKFYLVLDTERNCIPIFEWKYGGFRQTQMLEDIGIRPHYIQYMPDEEAFYVWSSMTGDMYILKEDSRGHICIKEVRHVIELEDQYVRSFSLLGEDILFPSGTNKYMILAKRDTLEVVERYPVSDDIAGMAYAMRIGDYYYITVSTDYYANQNKAKIIRTSDLNSLEEGVYEDVTSYFPQMGVPYYLERIDGKYYLTNHGTECAIYQFNVHDNIICNVGKIL